MSRLSTVLRSQSATSIAASDTTHRSSCHVPPHEASTACNAGKDGEPLPAPYGMHRQDSGYESLTAPSARAYCRRRSSASVSSSGAQPRTRPAVRRASKSGPVAYVPRDNPRPLQRSARPSSCEQQDGSVYFHFPRFQSPEHHQSAGATVSDSDLACHTTMFGDDIGYAQGHRPSPGSGTPTYPIPPQTTHYWTSDRTRRLEYAAIDAAGRGVRGWVMRHMVPDCFIPKDRRRVRFDDDRGSVVRYRLELEVDGVQQQTGELGGTKKRTARWFGVTAG